VKADAAVIARNLGGRRQGNQWRCTCPLGCGYSLNLRNGEDGTFLAYCHGPHEYGEIENALVEFGLLDGDAGCFIPPSSNEPDPTAKIEAARLTYQPLRPAAGTIVECYLRSRAIILPVPSALRCGEAPHRLGARFPAMVAPVVGVDGVLTGIHSTFLRSDGSGKADLDPEFQRETRGVIRGGSIRLAEYDPAHELLVGEGVETTLSAIQIFRLPGWSAVSCGGLRTLTLPSAVRSVCIAADNDPAGRRTASIAHERWTSEGRRVRVVMPPVAGTDFNDVLIARRG
jgi:hypothetical protein